MNHTCNDCVECRDYDDSLMWCMKKNESISSDNEICEHFISVEL